MVGWHHQLNGHELAQTLGDSDGQGSLMGCSPWDLEESDTTERLHFLFSLSCIGEGNGNPLQYSCLENPTDGGAWWATVHGVAKSQTRLSDFMDCSTPGFPVPHHLPRIAQVHVH